MKIYSKLVWDKDFNITEEISSEYAGPVVQMMGGSPSPPPPPPPALAPPSAPPPPTTYRTTGKALESTSRGRGVLIRPTNPLGNAGTDGLSVKDRESLFGPSIVGTKLASGILKLLGGGY